MGSSTAGARYSSSGTGSSARSRYGGKAGSRGGTSTDRSVADPRDELLLNDNKFQSLIDTTQKQLEELETAITKGNQEVREPHATTWADKDLACHRNDRQGFGLSSQ